VPRHTVQSALLPSVQRGFEQKGKNKADDNTELRGLEL